MQGHAEGGDWRLEGRREWGQEWGERERQRNIINTINTINISLHL
jgi:hypothetical protein